MSSQPILHRPQNLGIAQRSYQHDASGIEPLSGQTGPVKIRTGETPHHHAVLRPGKPANDAGGKGGNECTVLFVAADAKEFV